MDQTVTSCAERKSCCAGCGKRTWRAIGAGWTTADATFFMESGWKPTSDKDLDALYRVSTESDENAVFVIVDRETDRAVGTCGLYLIPVGLSARRVPNLHRGYGLFRQGFRFRGGAACRCLRVRETEPQHDLSRGQHGERAGRQVIRERPDSCAKACAGS